MPGVIAMCAGCDHVAGFVSAAIALCQQVFCSTSQSPGTFYGDTRHLSRIVVPHLHTAIPAATLLLLKSSKTEVLDLGWHGGLLEWKVPAPGSQ
jgi:hypothetical protein